MLVYQRATQNHQLQSPGLVFGFLTDGMLVLVLVCGQLTWLLAASPSGTERDDIYWLLPQ